MKKQGNLARQIEQAKKDVAQRPQWLKETARLEGVGRRGNTQVVAKASSVKKSDR